MDKGKKKLDYNAPRVASLGTVSKLTLVDGSNGKGKKPPKK